jgi:hypothetical protein
MNVVGKRGCVASPVNTGGDRFVYEFFATREMLDRAEGRPKTEPKIKLVGTPFEFSKAKADNSGNAALWCVASKRCNRSVVTAV